MRRKPRWAALSGRLILPAAFVVAMTVGACISGRVLTGYPGYPFARFDTELALDSTFFLLQPAVESEGFMLDYTILADGLITTRSTEMAGRPVFLNLVVEPLDQGDDARSSTTPGSRVWVAAYEETVSGAERINPLQGQVWADVMEMTSRLSAAVDGTKPEGPASGPDQPSGSSAAGGSES